MEWAIAIIDVRVRSLAPSPHVRVRSLATSPISRQGGEEELKGRAAQVISLITAHYQEEEAAVEACWKGGSRRHEQWRRCCYYPGLCSRL